MNNRWSALALLFFARTVMAFHFQTVAALSPFIEEAYGVGLGGVGFLFGLYMLPGIFLAIPSSRLAARIGEKEIVLGALAIMSVGMAMMALSASWSGLVVGRLLAGIGGIVINLVMTKMVADWFEGQEIATAMSVFIMSWPVGIAIALVTLPNIAVGFGLGSAFGIAAAAAVLATILFLSYSQAPTAKVSPVQSGLSRDGVLTGLATGATWGFLNAALAVVFGFGVALLVARGATVDSAGEVTSVTMFALAVIGPLGGILADKTGRYTLLSTLCVLGMAFCLALIVSGASTILLFVIFGLACGLCAGPIMSLPGRYLRPGERQVGMGIFFTTYYAAILLAPVLAGWAADTTEYVESALLVGIGFCGLTLLGLFLSRRLAVTRTRSVEQQ